MFLSWKTKAIFSSSSPSGSKTKPSESESVTTLAPSSVAFLQAYWAYLAATHSYVSGRNIGILADVTVQFRHKALAETHDLGVGLASRAEIRTSLCAAHRKRGQAVLESLLKCEELHYAQVHALMEADTALVRAESAVALHAEAAVDMERTSVVRPGNTEYHYAFGLRNTFKYFLVNEIPFCKIIHMGITTNNAHKTTKKMFLIKGAKELPGQDRREKKSRKPAPMPPGIRRYTC